MKYTSAEIDQAIDTATSSARTLGQLLEKENQALKAGTLHELEHITRDKQPHIQGINAAEKLIQDYINAKIADPTDHGNNNRKSRLNALLHYLDQCRHLNIKNGQLININLGNTHNALSILRHGTQANENTYAKDGLQKGGGNTKRTIAKI